MKHRASRVKPGTYWYRGYRIQKHWNPDTNETFWRVSDPDKTPEAIGAVGATFGEAKQIINGWFGW